MLTLAEMQLQNMHRSKLFKHDNDKDLFYSVFKSIEDSELIQSLKIAQDICQNIAEFANGEWKYCSVSDCDESISILLT